MGSPPQLPKKGEAINLSIIQNSIIQSLSHSIKKSFKQIFREVFFDLGAAFEHGFEG